MDLAKLIRYFPSNSELAVRILCSPNVAVLRENEVEEFARAFTETCFEDVQETIEKLHLNNLKFYFMSCAKLKQPMFVINQGDQ